MKATNKNKNIYYNNKKIFTAECNIRKILEVGNNIVVLLKISEFNNIIVIDQTGVIVWKNLIFSDDQCKDEENDVFIDIDPYDKKTFIVWSFRCCRYIVDIGTGKVIDAVFTK